MLLSTTAQDAVDIVGDDGGLVLRALSSSVVSPGFLAAYSAHVIRPPSAALHRGDDGGGDESMQPPEGANSDATSVERWAGTAGTEPQAQAIRSLQASAHSQSRVRSVDWHTLAHGCYHEQAFR